MLKIRVIPCLDVNNGRVVKGVNFVDLKDAGDPVEQAKIYNDEGADELCFLDITASSDNRDTLLGIVQKTAENCFIPLTVGGGVRTVIDIQKLLYAGADKISINTAAILNENLITESSSRFGSQCIVAAVDAKKNYDDWIVYSHGGTKNTGINVLSWLERLQRLGAGEILLTSMDKDGTKDGFDLNLLKKANDILNIPVIASGGVGSLKHFEEGVTIGRANALLAASVFHFAEFSILDVKRYLQKKSIQVRL